MLTTATKPIRSTNIEFKDNIEMEKFLNYASSTEKTSTPGIERLRTLMKKHQPAPERK